MFAVAGIDPLGAVAEPEVAATDEPVCLELRSADIFGHPGIYGALVDDRRAPGWVDRPAIIRVAEITADRSGRLSLSTGVGTVTM